MLFKYLQLILSCPGTKRYSQRVIPGMVFIDLNHPIIFYFRPEKLFGFSLTLSFTLTYML